MDAEFEVYLDIDGAAEEEEEEELQLQGSAYSALGHKNALHQIQKALPGSGSKTATAAMKLKSPSARDHGLSTPINVLDSDNSDLEVDVDTPFEGTLFGQTKPREQKQPGSTVLSALRNISQASLGLSQKGSSSASVARKSTTSTNSTNRRVAVKSASPRKPVKSSSAHVAKKSSTLQSRPISSSASSSSGISHGSADFLQVKFGPVKPVPPSDSLPVAFQSQFRTVNNLSSITTTLSSSITTTLSGTFGHPQQASSVTQASTSGTEKAPQCFKFSASKQNIDCPMCLLTMQQKSLSHHLKQKHDITLRVCTECKLAFTNVSVYSEHYAFHLQQEEDGHFGLPSVALPTKNQEIFSSEPVPLPDIRHKEPPESWTRTRSFKFLERSGDKRPCPECGTMIRQHSVRHHLKTVHDLNLRTCKICQLGYTDMNLYNEHCAYHYEQQEKKMEGQKKSLISETNSTNPTIPVVPPAEHLAKQTISLVRKAPEQNNTSRHIWQSAPLSHVKSVQIKEEVFDDPLAHTVKSFEFKERSVEKIPCPECSQLIAQNSLRGHLQVVHSMSMKSCRKCPLAFTDTDAFFEHLACHYQQKGMNTLSSPPKNKRVSSPHLPLPALPPKPKAPSVAKRKNSPSKQPIPSSSGSYQASVADVPFPLQPKLPPKPRKPFLSKKRRLSPGLSAGFSESDREVGFEEASYQTKARLNSDSTSRPTHYRSNQKAAVRKRQPSPSPATTRRPSSQSPSPVRRKQSGPASNIQLCPEPLRKRQSSGSPARRLSTRSPSPVRRKQLSSSPASKIHFSPVSVSKRQSSTSPVDQPPPKKTRTQLDVSREQIPKVKVNVVSLETAAQPFDCKTCLAANNLALVCPQSFRKYSQQKQKVFSCSNCPATFRQREQLKVHKELQCTSMSKQHFAHCGLQTDNENERGSEKSLHEIAKASLEKSEGDGNGVECIVCQEQFPYRSALLRHINYHTHQYCCSACKKSFADSIELLNHFQIVHNGKSQMLCRYCRKKFDHMSEFKRHLSGHKDGTVVACTVCGIKFSDSKKMLMHLRNEHCQGNPEESHVKDGRVCRTCGRVFKKAKQLAHHLRSAHGTRNPIVTKFLSCRICKTVFHKKQGLASHYLRRHGMSMPASLSTFAATKTGDGTANPSRKNSQSDLQHQPGPPGSNTGVKGAAVQNSVADFDLDCPICKRRYSSRRTLLKHMTNIHQSKGSATIGKYSSYKCSICKKTLYTPHGLKVHCQIVHGKQQSNLTNSFKCIKCPKSFTRLANLKTHYRFHHGTKNPDAMPNFPCPICNQVYTTKKGMRYHWHKNHPESFQDNRVLPKKPNTSGSNTSVAETSSSTSCATSKITKPDVSSAKKHSCPLCERTFELRNSLFRHLQVNHGLTKSDIEYNFRNQTSVSNEKASTPRAPSASVNPKFFICKICKDCFSIRRSFMKHQRKVHGGKNGFFQCRSLKCKKTFSKLPGLQNHISKAHPGMSLYRCVACRTWFDTSDEVLCHICASVEDSEGASVKNSESGSTISQSESEPPGTSSSQVSLTEQEFRYRCLTCGAGFHISRDWTRHVQEHSKEANGRSADYEKVLDATDKIRLNIFDILSANNDSVFTCEHCSKIFTEAVALTSHVCKNQAACFEDVEKQKLAEECVESVAVDMKELGDHDEHSSSEVKAAAVEESKHEKVEIGNLAAIGSSYHKAEPSEESKDSPVCDIGNSEPSVEDGEGERKVSLEKGGVTCGEEQCTSLDGVGRIQSPPGEEETLLPSVDKPTPAMHDKLASSAEDAGKGTPEERKERVRTKDAGKPAPQIEELASCVEEAGKPAPEKQKENLASCVEEAGKPASSVEEAVKPAPDEHTENLASSVEEAGKPASSVEEAGKPAAGDNKENLASSVEDAGKLIHCQEEHEENLASSTEDASKPPPEAEEQLPSSNGEEQSPEGHEEQLPPSIGNPPIEHGQLPSSTKDAGIPSPGDEGNSETLETVILPTVEHKLNEKEDVPKGAENGSDAVTEETDRPDILNDSVESLTKAQEDELLMDEEGSHL